MVRRKFRNGSRQSCFGCGRKWPHKNWRNRRTNLKITPSPSSLRLRLNPFSRDKKPKLSGAYGCRSIDGRPRLMLPRVQSRAPYLMEPFVQRVSAECQARDSSDNPKLYAFCRVAPSVRVSVFAILDARILLRANAFKVRTCPGVHARFSCFLAMFWTRPQWLSFSANKVCGSIQRNTALLEIAEVTDHAAPSTRGGHPRSASRHGN